MLCISLFKIVALRSDASIEEVTSMSRSNSAHRCTCDFGELVFLANTRSQWNGMLHAMPHQKSP